MENLVSNHGLPGSRVLVLGHTGFKGSWLCMLLVHLGCKVYGCSNSVPHIKWSSYSVFEIEKYLSGEFWVDLSERDQLGQVLRAIKPDYVFHLAAQSLVKVGYEAPYDTIRDNTLMILNYLDVIRKDEFRDVVTLITTTDKVYDDLSRPANEDDALGVGGDPYSSSKRMIEGMIQTYCKVYPHLSHSLVVARAGNVIGGGDVSRDRIMYDVCRGVIDLVSLTLRMPESVRPWQYVLDVVVGYCELINFASSVDSTDDKPLIYNLSFGGGDSELSVKHVVDIACKTVGADDFPQVEIQGQTEFAETNYLQLSSLRYEKTFGVSSRRVCPQIAVEKTIEWAKAWKAFDPKLADKFRREIEDAATCLNLRAHR